MDAKEKELCYIQNKNLIHTALKPYRKNLKKIEEQTGFSYEDLFQECSLYFLKLIERYDPEKSKFSTFVVKSLNLYINTVILKNSTFFSVPLDVKRNHFRMISKSIHEESNEWIAKEMNISPNAVKKAKQFVASHLSLDSTYTYTPDQNISLLDYMQTTDFSDQLVLDLLIEQFSKTMLTDSEKKTLFYLLDGYMPDEISSFLSVSKTTVMNYISSINSKFNIVTQRCLFSFQIL
jgi:DNA-directed RNA polymerase specialized sigma subunit